jgi:hypothetical protein
LSTGTVSREVETDRANPYVGPRSLRREDGIYGRNREIRELRASLLAHRIVLLYSHSGAGKTSLIEAGLRPEFEGRGFQVFPTIRVGYEAPPDAGDVNRYLFSTLNSLEEGQQAEEQLDPTELAATNLDEYVRRRDEQIPNSDPLLIFDQFEELFTLDPTDWDDKREFLEEIGRMLEDRGRWALFAMREDFIAQLDPYVALIPTQLATRYRLELLKASEAVEAIKQPASSVGVDFTDAAAEHLVNDLRRIQVQRGDRAVLELGPSVEPVQLQVVCHRVWASLPEDVTLIEPDDIADAGTVNEALAEFYETQVKIAADRTKSDEYAIRTWFEKELITPDGFRTQVREGPNGDADSVVQSLQSSHLIRSDRIRGAEWYELSHDRFVEPIQTSNADFMQRRRRRRLRLIMTAVGIVLAAVILVGLAWMADRDAPSATLGSDAEEIQLGDTVTGVIEAAGDTSVYAFEAEEDEIVLVTVFALGDLTPDVALLDPGEARLAGTSGDPVPGEPEVIAITSTRSGRHLITVTGTRGSTGEFELQLSRPAAGELLLDTPVSGSIADGEAVAVHRIEGVVAGDSLVVRLHPGDELLTAAVELFGPNGVNLVSAVSFADGSAELVLEAPLDGAYLVTVRGSGGATGGYEIEREEATSLTMDQAIEGIVDAVEDITAFSVRANADETVLITVVAPDGGLNPVVDLYDPLGAYVSSGVGSFYEPGEPWILAAPISTTGLYHVTVKASFAEEQGPFDITVSRAEVSDVLETSVGGSVTDQNAVDVFRLNASAGDSIALRTTPDSDLETAPVTVFGPDGAFVAREISYSDGSGPPLIFAAPSEGSYLVTVSGYSRSTGDYEVTKLGVRPLDVDQKVQSVGSRSGDPLVFSFDAEEDEIPLVSMVAHDDAQPTLNLYDPGGLWVSSGVGFEEPDQPWILPAPIATSGVHHLTASVDGPFDLTLTRPPPRDLAADKSIKDAITDEMPIDLYRMEAAPEEAFLVEVVPEIAFESPVFEVFGPDGWFISSASTSGGVPVQMPFEAIDDGPHVITVSGYQGSTGPYRLTVLSPDSPDAFETAWDVASLVPDLVPAEPTDYIRRYGEPSVTCEEWDRTGLVEEDSISLSPQFPLAVDHFVWAWAASFDSGEGVASYLDSYGEGCILNMDLSIRLFPTAELDDAYLWYITTQPDGEGARELLDSVGVIGRTDTDVVEIQLVMNDFEGFVREIVIDPNNPYDNAEARELAEGLIEPLQTRLSEMSP